MRQRDDDVAVRFWECTTSDCSKCIPFLTGMPTMRNFTAARDNLTECFYGWPSYPSDGGLTPIIGYQSFDEGMGATQSQDQEFFDLLIGNGQKPWKQPAVRCRCQLLDTFSAGMAVALSRFEPVRGGDAI